MKILITGGTGFVGSRLVKALENEGHHCVILTRYIANAKDKLSPDSDKHSFVLWDGKSEIDFKAFEGVEACVNLVGESIANKRWSDKQKERILNSRVNATRSLVSGIKAHGDNCKVLVSASAIGRYPVNKEESLKEGQEADASSGFLPSVCHAWEQEALKASEKCRVVIGRIGVVLGSEGGALSKLLPIFKLGVGGPVGSGSQMMSWIHVDDVVGFIQFAVNNEQLNGEYNLVAPNVVSNKEFSKSLARAISRPALFPAPPFALKLAMGEMSTIVLDSQIISSEKLKESGYNFKYPKIDEAMKEVASN